MKTSVILPYILFLSAITGCGVFTNSSKSAIIRRAENTPVFFSPPTGVILDNTSCKSPLIDKRNDTKIILISSKNGIGIYQVITGKYGIRKGELLRVDCKTGKSLGIVKE